MLLLLCTAAFQSTTAQPVKLLLSETNSTITLSLIHDKQLPDQYRSIIIHSSGTTTTITAQDPVLRIPATRKESQEAYIWNADIPGLKIDPSRYFLVGQYTAEGKPHTLLFFLSGPRESNASTILIVGFSAEGKPFNAFERQYDMTSFEQTDDGALLTGKETMSQDICGFPGTRKGSFTTYDPFSIFFFYPGTKPIYQLDASRVYNLKHYACAGPHSSERVTVIEDLRGHPKFFAVDKPRADKLMAQMKCIP